MKMKNEKSLMEKLLKQELDFILEETDLFNEFTLKDTNLSNMNNQIYLTTEKQEKIIDSVMWKAYQLIDNLIADEVFKTIEEEKEE